MNSMVSRLLTIITGRLSPYLNYRMYARPQTNKQTNNQTYNQDDQSFISILDYP